MGLIPTKRKRVISNLVLELDRWWELDWPTWGLIWNYKSRREELRCRSPKCQGLAFFQSDFDREIKSFSKCPMNAFMSPNPTSAYIDMGKLGQVIKGKWGKWEVFGTDTTLVSWGGRPVLPTWPNLSQKRNTPSSNCWTTISYLTHPNLTNPTLKSNAPCPTCVPTSLS